jgi:GNAT superfamily N-acetyltransferase
MTGAVIRPRREDDLAALADVLIRVHERDGYPVEGATDPLAWLRSDHQLGAWTADLDGRPVGHVLLTTATAADSAAGLWTERTGADPETIAVLGRLFVDPDARGRHLGRRLTAAAVRTATQVGRRTVLDVMAKDVAAIRTYEALGWTRLGPTQHALNDGRQIPALGYVSPE